MTTVSLGEHSKLTDDKTVLTCVAIAAPPERVFKALTTDEAEQWWGAADTYRIVDWAADLRVGGKWSLGVQLPNGDVLPASGEFLEVDAPRKLVQTRRYDWDHPTLGRTVTTVTFRLDAIPEGTRLTVRHDGFGSSEPADEHAAGWDRLLGWLQSYLDKEQK